MPRGSLVGNRFALSEDDDSDNEVDVIELLRAKEAEKDARARKKAAKQTPARTDKEIPNTNIKENKSVINEKSQRTESSRNRKNQDQPPRFAKQQANKENNQNFEQPPEENETGRGSKTKHAKSGKAVPVTRPGKREFERHSGSDKTGIKAIEKRDGAGPHNWGSEIEAQLDASEAVPEEKSDNEAPVEETALETPESPEDEEEKQMTLEEWKAAQAASKVAQSFNVRKANEGVDDSLLKAKVELKKKPLEEKKKVVEDEYEIIVEDTKAVLEKLNIQINFSQPARGGGFRGGRGGFRGGFRDGERPPRDDRPPRQERPPRRGGFGGSNDRPKGGFGGNSDDKPRGGFGGSSDDKPRGGFGGSSNDDRPRGGFGGNTDSKPRGGFGGSNDDRPRGGFGGNTDDKPRGGFGGNTDRPKGGFGGNDSRGGFGGPRRGGFRSAGGFRDKPDNSYKYEEASFPSLG